MLEKFLRILNTHCFFYIRRWIMYCGLFVPLVQNMTAYCITSKTSKLSFLCIYSSIFKCIAINLNQRWSNVYKLLSIREVYNIALYENILIVKSNRYFHISWWSRDKLSTEKNYLVDSLSCILYISIL